MLMVIASRHVIEHGASRTVTIIVWAYLLLASVPVPAAGEETTTCGVRFTVPAAWDVKRFTSNDAQCLLRVRPGDWTRRENDPVDPQYPIEIAIRDVPFNRAAEDHGFRMTPDGWIVLGRQGTTSTATFLRQDELDMVRGTPIIGIYDSDLKQTVGGEEDRIVIGNGRRSAVITRGPFERSAAFERLLSSFRFVRSEQTKANGVE